MDGANRVGEISSCYGSGGGGGIQEPPKTIGKVIGERINHLQQQIDRLQRIEIALEEGRTGELTTEDLRFAMNI
jgi:hypothetical protein